MSRRSDHTVRRQTPAHSPPRGVISHTNSDRTSDTSSSDCAPHVIWTIRSECYQPGSRGPRNLVTSSLRLSVLIYPAAVRAARLQEMIADDSVLGTGKSLDAVVAINAKLMTALRAVIADRDNQLEERLQRAEAELRPQLEVGRSACLDRR